MEAPIAGVRIVRIGGEFKINPSNEEQEQADINLVVAGSREGICMVEGGANEANEEAMIEAMDLAFAEIQKIIGAIEELREKAGFTASVRLLAAAVLCAARTRLREPASFSGHRRRRRRGARPRPGTPTHSRLRRWDAAARRRRPFRAASPRRRPAPAGHGRRRRHRGSPRRSR